MPPPSGILRPSAAAIAKGLSFAQAFQNGPVPWLSRGAVVSTLQAGAVRSVGRGGLGMSGANGWWGSTSAANTYSVGTNAGTLIIYFLADHDSGSSGNRILLSFGNASFPTTPGIAISNFSGTWFAGWADGADKRVSVASAGLYANGDLVSTAFAYGPTGQIAYMQGRAIASGAAATYASTAGADCTIGNYISAFPWNVSAAAGIYYALAFDRQLSPSEIAAAALDPWWWIEPEAAPRVGSGTVAYNLTVDPLAYEHTLADVGLTSARTLDVEALAYEHTLADVALSYRQTSYPLDVDALAYRYTLANVGLTFTPLQGDVDTHDGFKRRTRRERALEAAAKRLRDEARDEAVALRLEIEAAMGMVAEAAEEAPESVAEAVPPVVARAEAAVARLAPVRAVEPATLAEARDIARTLRTLVEDMERARALAEDDEEVLMLLRAFR